ncbi:tRNA pseudouridine(38-40) synthase TruA [Ruminococcus sp.]|uniref:tRNA pseudouridine(38-40) synthase TruA n=1 Tax=Ruminococcus sp. TaxID=41978 RepID=UPI0025E0FCB0|nr:tRNA pseudouridine(38-40) synthase TruA [Ruminococcus sp.]MBO4524161.1 tRNA pseudouridine(38-40) synthase TruA [Ruminococcus sp.]
MRNLKVTIAYRGTKYHGFQRQNNALTVQEVLENKLSKVLDEPVTVIGCSRTDTGVHANMFCFNVKTNSNINCLGFCRGVNGELPDDISILSCEDVPLDFHARYDCKGKEYIYKMHCSESKNPFAADLMLHYRRKFDIEATRKAAEYLVGTHDFSSFCADCTNVSTTVRTIYSFKIENSGDSVIMLVKGNGFLYNMIRIIAGTLIDVSEKRIAPDDIPTILAAKDRLKAGRTAMAHGLYLNRVFYSEEELFKET